MKHLIQHHAKGVRILTETHAWQLVPSSLCSSGVVEAMQLIEDEVMTYHIVVSEDHWVVA